MRVLAIEEVLRMESGETVPGLRGFITSVGAYYTGNSEHGPWSLQRISLADPAGNKIRLRFSNRPKLGNEWKGHEIVLTSVNGKNGLAGMKVAEDEYRGVRQKEIVVTERAVLDTVANAAACGALKTDSTAETPYAQPMPAQQPSAPAPAQTHPPTHTQRVPVAPPAQQQARPAEPQPPQQPAPAPQVQPLPASHPQSLPAAEPQAAPAACPAHGKQSCRARADLAHGESERLDKMLFILAQTYLRCMDAADWVNAERTANKQQPMSAEHYQACVSSLFIQVMKNCQN